MVVCICEADWQDMAGHDGMEPDNTESWPEEQWSEEEEAADDYDDYVADGQHCCGSAVCKYV